MKFKLRRASDSYKTPSEVIDITSLEDLMALQEKQEHKPSLVIDFRDGKIIKPTIYIYDDYLE